MRAFWLTWNRKKYPEEELRQDTRRRIFSWSVAAHRQIRSGDRVYLFKQGQGTRGIFGVGEIVGEPEEGEPFAGSAGSNRAYYAPIRFSRLIFPGNGFLLPLESLRDVVPASLINSQSSGIGVPTAVDEQLQRLLDPTAPLSPEVADSSFDPSPLEDQHAFVLQQVRARRGQAAFRNALIAAHGARCMVTGCTTLDVVEAAHIRPFGKGAGHDLGNGLLLRADIHTLFDCGLIAFEPETLEVILAPRLEKSDYAGLSGRRLTFGQVRPSTVALQERLEKFRLVVPA